MANAKKVVAVPTPKIVKEKIKEVKEVKPKTPEIKPITSIRVCGQVIEGKVIEGCFISNNGVTYAIPK